MDVLKRQRGAALAEFAVVVPLFVALLYASLYLIELGIWRIQAQEVARFASWSFVHQELSDFSSGEFKHNERFTQVQNSVRYEVESLYGDLDPIASSYSSSGRSMLLSKASLDLGDVGDLRNERVTLLPDWANRGWAEPISTLGLALSFAGLGVSVESLVEGMVARLRFNQRGQIMARGDVKVALPDGVREQKRAQQMAAVGDVRGADLTDFAPRTTGRILRDPDGQRIESTLIVDPWKIYSGQSVVPPQSSDTYSRIVREVSDRSLRALPGSPLLHLYMRLDHVLQKIPDRLLTTFGLGLKPNTYVVSRPYTKGRSGTPNYRGTIEPGFGQVDIFSLTNTRPENDSTVRNFESLPIYDDPRRPEESRLLESLNARGPNFMGCRLPEKRDCAL